MTSALLAWMAVLLFAGLVGVDSAHAAPPAAATCQDAADAVEDFLLEAGETEVVAASVAADILTLCEANSWADASVDEIVGDIIDCLDFEECDEAWLEIFASSGTPDVTVQEIRDIAFANAADCDDAANEVEDFLLFRGVPEGVAAAVAADLLDLCLSEEWGSATGQEILDDILACIDEAVLCDPDDWQTALDSGVDPVPGVTLEEVAEVIAGVFGAGGGPPFGDLPTPPPAGGKPAFVPDVICDFVENMVMDELSTPAQPHCQ